MDVRVLITNTKTYNKMTLKDAIVLALEEEGRCCPSRETKPLKCLPSVTIIYIGFILWRYITIILYSVSATKCFFGGGLISRCESLSGFPFPSLYELFWQSSSFINYIIAIAILKRLPQFPGFHVVGKKLFRIARFWSLLFQLLLVIIFNVVMHLHKQLVTISIIEFGFVFDEVAATAVVCLWNFVPAPNKDNSCRSFQVCYYLTLVAFFLENFYMFLLMSSQAAGIHEFEHVRGASLQAVVIIMNASKAAFYFGIMKFFWSRIFEPNADLFEKETF